MTDEQTIQGPGSDAPLNWADDLNGYLQKNPNASDAELFKRYPQLNGDSKRIYVAISYGQARASGTSDADMAKMYPDLVEHPTEEKPAPQPKETPIKGMSTADLFKREPNTSESTAFGSQQIVRNMQATKAAADQQAKITAKYKPMMDKAMSDIGADRDHYVKNNRPALDFHPGAPDAFYETPRTDAIDAYLKSTVPDSDDRYYLRNKILQSLQQKKDQAGLGQIVQKKIDALPSIQKAQTEVIASGQAVADPKKIMARAQEIDPGTQEQVQQIEQQAPKQYEDAKNEAMRVMQNNSTSLLHDADGNITKVNALDPNTPFHDQITGAGKALQGVMQAAGDTGQMAAGVLSFFGLKSAGDALQKMADRTKADYALPGGDQTLSEQAAGAIPTVIGGYGMGRVASALGAPIFAGINGAAARGMIGKVTEGALGGLALAPINSAMIAHDYYVGQIKAGEAPEIAKAKADNVFSKNLLADLVISPVQFGIMNAPVSSVLAKTLLKYGVSPAVAGAHFMAQGFIQSDNPAQTAWQYATSPEGMKTGITGALVGMIQHYSASKLNDWQNDKNMKDAFSFGRGGADTPNLPNSNIIAATVLHGMEMKDGPRRADELKGLIGDLHAKGVYSDPEAQKINGIIDDVAAVKGQVPKIGTNVQRMAVLNELLNQREYGRMAQQASIPAMQDLVEQKIKDSNTRIQAILDEQEPLYFVNGNETGKDQLMQFAKENPDMVKSKNLNIDIAGDPKTEEAIQKIKDTPLAPEEGQTMLVNHGGNINVWDAYEKNGREWNDQASKDYLNAQDIDPATIHEGHPEREIIEARHAITDEDKKGVTSGPTDVPLNDEGRQQASALADDVKDMGISRVVSSDLPRGEETGKIVADQTGAVHETDPGLKSWDIGDFDKMKDTEFKQVEKHFVNNPDETEYQGKKLGESFNQYKDRVIAARSALEPQEDVNNPPIAGRSLEFSDFYHKFKDEIRSVPDSSFDARIDMPIDQKSREGAVKDIEKGKPETKRAKLFLDELQRQYDNGVLEYTHGRGNHVEHLEIPVDEFNRIHDEAASQVVEEIKGGWEPQEGLAKLFLEEADKNEEDEPRQIAGSETGRSTTEREAGASEDERIQTVRAGDAQEAGDRTDSGEDESRPAANRAPGFIRAPGASEDAAATENEPRPAKGSESDLSSPSLRESYVRENLNSEKDPTLKKKLTDSGMSDQEATDLIDKARAEENMSPEDIIRQAVEIGKNAGKNKQTALFPEKEGRAMEPGLLKTLNRWYFDGVDDVSDVKSIIRKNKGNEEFNIDKIYHQTKKLVDFWNSIPKVKQMAFILGVEKPELLKNQPQSVKEMAAGYRERLDKTFEIIGKAMPDLNFIEDYFPHFWDKPEETRNFFASTLSKAPLEGSKTFAKKRFFETIVAGLKAGYKLSTTNPEEIVRLAEANAWKFKTAHDIFTDMKSQGYLKYSMNDEKPEGWKTVSDPLFTKMAASIDKNGNPDLVRGAYYMPPDVAKLINGYLSLGIKSPVKTFIQQYNNIKNLFQLGVGFFHVGTTSLDAMVSGMTNGIQKLTAGNPRGLIDLATLGNLPATLMRGFKAKADWNKGIVTADTQALMDANAKVGRQKMYSLDTAYNMKKAFGQLRADGDFKQIPKLLWNTLLYLPEAINKPLMEHWVPALKVGGYLRSLDSELSSRKNMTPAETQNAKQKLWDSTDDRLGQVVYDNVFMNKAAKDLGFMAIRSAGWTGGTIRAVSGGLAELPRSGQRLASGQGLSQRTAYLAALPLTVGIMGGMLHYLMTGNPPDEMKDYFFPKDGTKSADGTDHRLVLPSYMKDILAYSKTPFKTLLHKTAPFLNDVVELYSNKDFYGVKIYNKDDPFFQKGLDALKHEGETMEPFSFRTDPTAPPQTAAQAILQKFGITPAPREREKSDMQNKISQAYQDQIGTKEEGTTHEEMEKNIARKHLREFIFNGGDYKDASQEWKDAAAIHPRALGKFIQESHMDPYERYYKALTPETKTKLYNDMSDEDKDKYGKYVPKTTTE